MDVVRKIFRYIWSIKGKIIICLLLIPVFVLVLFPVDDISDLVTKEVAKATGNQIYVSFDHMNLGFFPTAGVGFDRLSLEAGQLPPLSIRRLDINPSIFGLLMNKPQGEAYAQGIFRGDIRVAVSPGKKLENGVATQNINIEAEKLNLGDIRQFASLPVRIRGQASAKVSGNVDPAFTAQPDINVELQSPNFELQPTSVETLMGPLVLPGLKLGRLQLKGRLSAGQFLIEEGFFGKDGDDLAGSVKGRIGLEIRNFNGRMIPVASNYELRFDFAAKEGFEKRSETLLLLINSHRTAEAAGGRYKFILTGDARNQSFNITPLR